MRLPLAAAALFLSIGTGALAAEKPGLAEYSARFLGIPYMQDPLGEGEGAPYDADPLIRFDAFDCQTYVETVLARGDREKLEKIRYGGKPAFASRHHFPDAWVRGNSGVVRDITGAFSLMVLGAPPSIRQSVMTPAAWYKKTHGMDVAADSYALATPYIPMAGILENRGKFSAAVSSPMVALVIVSDSSMAKRSGTDLHVAHMGFLLPPGAGKGIETQEPVFRHASSIDKKVEDVPFFGYISSLPAKYVGIGLLSIE
jgi:hypothetical protein